VIRIVGDSTPDRGLKACNDGLQREELSKSIK
jgi:hypothetical protein